MALAANKKLKFFPPRLDFPLQATKIEPSGPWTNKSKQTYQFKKARFDRRVAGQVHA